MLWSYESDSRKTGININKGALSMDGKNKGVESLLQKHLDDQRIDNNNVALYCLIYQDALCAKDKNKKTSELLYSKWVSTQEKKISTIR